MVAVEGARPGKEGLTMEILVRALREVSGTGQAPTGDRYHLKPPTFGGDGDVKQFI